MARLIFDDVMAADAPLPHWSNKNKLRFHAFAPKGVMATKKALNDRISRHVDAGNCKSGAIIAYGSLDVFAYNELHRVMDLSRPTTQQVTVILYMLEASIKRAEAFLATLPQLN